MKISQLFLWLGISAVAGAGLGLLADREHPAKSGLLGAAAGAATGSIAAGIYQYKYRETIPYYSESSPLYEESSSL